MSIHLSMLAGKIPETEKPGGLQLDAIEQAHI